mgnify:CR=1 FL=1
MVVGLFGGFGAAQSISLINQGVVGYWEFRVAQCISLINLAVQGFSGVLISEIPQPK